MKTEGVKEYRVGYPTKEQTLSNPMLLKKTPERWKGIAVCCSAMSIMTLSACTNVQSTIKQILSGSGNSLMGRMALPTYTLSEDEAIDIIADEAKKQGLIFDIENTKVVEAKLPTAITYDYETDQFSYSELNTKIEVDGVAKDKNIYFEYLSVDDINKWSEDEVFINYVDFKERFATGYLETLKDGTLETKEDKIVAAFFVASKYEQDQPEEDLRRQVKDFIEMLKAQELIN